MVEVFKTSVTDREVARETIRCLEAAYPGGCVSFDLEDCDKVLRIDHHDVTAEQAIKLMHSMGHRCEPLD